jgi:hypothetical protein
MLASTPIVSLWPLGRRWRAASPATSWDGTLRARREAAADSARSAPPTLACSAALAAGAAPLIDPAGDLRVGVQDPRKLSDSIDDRVHRGYVITLDQHHDVRGPKERIGTDNAIQFPDLSHQPLRTWVLRVDKHVSPDLSHALEPTQGAPELPPSDNSARPTATDVAQGRRRAARNRAIPASVRRARGQAERQARIGPVTCASDAPVLDQTLEC